MTHSLIAQTIGLPGPSGKPIYLSGPLVGINSLADVISHVLAFVFPLAGVLLFLFLVWGGFDFMLSGGEPEKIQAGRAKITSALIGFLLLVFSLFIVRLIAFVFKLGGGIF